MARPISSEVREQIERDLRARWGTLGIRTFAKDHDVSATTIRKIAGEIGLTAGVAHERVQKAASMQRATNAQRRAQLAERLLDEAQAALDAIGEGSTIGGFSFGEFVEGRTKRITARDRQALLVSAGIALDKHRMLDQYDADSDTADVAKFLNALGGAVGAAAGRAAET